MSTTSYATYTDLLGEGSAVTVHGLSRDELNGLKGGVVCWQGGRVVVSLGGTAGRKAFKPENLTPDMTYLGATFITSTVALVLSVAYVCTSMFNPWSATGNVFWKMALVMHIIQYLWMCKNMHLLAFKTDALGSLAGNRAGQVLLWLVAFLILGQSCYFLLAAMGCYSIIHLAKIHEHVLPTLFTTTPILSLFAHNLSRVNNGLRNTTYAMADYSSRDWTGRAKPTPPAHPLEVAGVIFELFAGVQQFFQIVLAATQSLIMFTLSWRYLGYRYRTPENRTVRTVFNKAREQLLGYLGGRFVPRPLSETVKWGIEWLWGPPVEP